jgi:sec-independent protein translocase protein TatB
MFDFSSGELLLIALAVLIFIKPKDLPMVLRTVGQWTGKIRRMAGEFQDQFREAMREAEMADIKKQVDEMTAAAQDITRYNPLDDVHKELNSALSDKPAEAGSVQSAAQASPEAIPPAVSAPVSADANIPSGEHVDVAAGAPQPSSNPEPAAEAKPASGGGG